MVYITGDLHGDISRLKSKAVRKLRRNDYLIVCGDFGFLWDGSENERRILEWIGKRKFHVLFVDGANDNLPLLEKYDRIAWNGGEVHAISGKLKHLCRGSIFTIDNFTIFAFGGGIATDDDSFGRDADWISLQLPTDAEIEAARANLMAHNNTVDYVVTHQCSLKLKSLLLMKDTQASNMEWFFDEVRSACTYKGWFFGHYHLDKYIPQNEVAVFQHLWPLGTDLQVTARECKKR
jgi:Predicted phosphoesterases, related to the Icc protein